MRSLHSTAGPSGTLPRRSIDVSVPVGTIQLAAEFTLPSEDHGVVVFVHGSGSSRHSSRDRMVAHALGSLGLGTLQFDLRTAEEESLDRIIGWLRFDAEALAQRVMAATQWVLEQPDMQQRSIGYFGAGSGAAAALIAAARMPDEVGAVVSRGGRPDLAGSALRDVRAPTLLLVGDHDAPCLGINRHALATLQCEKELVVIDGADHLFTDPRALEQAAALAVTWLRGFLGRDELH